MGTLVICVDRSGELSRKTGVDTPVSGWDDVESLALSLGLTDPEDSSVNCLLEGLRTTESLREGEADEATVAVVSGVSEHVVGADRAVAAQLDELLERHDPKSVVLVVDTAEDERLIPLVESRVRVDAVDRVVVRQARDIESTYYLLKQFLGDEQLRQTVLVPLGLILLVFPALLLTIGNLAIAASSITAVIGLFLLYKGLGVESYLAAVPGQVQNAVYTGRVSIVTYVVAAGLALVGLFAGVLSASALSPRAGTLIVAMDFAFDSVPWLTLAALTASTGRLIDEAIQSERLGAAYLNLPFAAIAIGFVVRGFAAYFLERADVSGPLELPALSAGPVTIETTVLTAEQHLAVFVVFGVLVSIIGIRVSSAFGGAEIEEDADDHDTTEEYEESTESF